MKARDEEFKKLSQADSTWKTVKQHQDVKI